MQNYKTNKLVYISHFSANCVCVSQQRWLQLCNPDTNLPLTNKQRAGMKETALTTQGKELVRLTVEEHENGQ